MSTPHRTLLSRRRVAALVATVLAVGSALTLHGSGASAATAAATTAAAGTASVGTASVGTASATSAPAYTFDDEFAGATGTRPTGNWTFQTGGGGWGNNELQTYTDRAGNAQLDGAGHLVISAKKETFTGTDGITRNWTSARLVSKTTVGPGYVEARVLLPQGQGLWPAFWMLGSNISTVGWPKCGEIDVMESVNAMSTAYGTVHGFTEPGSSYQYSGSQTPATGLAAAWHTVGVSWTHDAMSWYVDGVRYFTGLRSALPANQIWAFDQQQYILLNLAVGGNGPGAPNASTPTTSSMQVDWVRAGAGTPPDAG